MKKLFTFVCAALLSAGMWADTAVLSWQLGENGAEAKAANSITGATGSEAEGWTIAMTGNTEKNWAAGSKLTYNGKEYKTLKNSNGVKITVTLPTGKFASKVEFYAVTNDETTKGTLKEFDEETCKDTVHSLKDYAHPTIITKTLETPSNKFTFLFGGKQVCFLAVVTYAGNSNPNCADPQISFGDWSDAQDGFPVTITTNEAGVSLSYSVDGADYVAYNGVFHVGSKASVSAKASKEGYNDAIVTVTAPLHSIVRQLESDALTFVEGDEVSEGMRFQATHITLMLHDALWQNEALANNDPNAPEEFGYKAYIAGQTNPASKNGAIPTGGCYYTFEPATGGVLKVAAKVGANKKLCVATADEQLTVKMNDANVAFNNVVDASVNTYGIIEFTVKKDVTYYVWVDGSKMALFGFVFAAEGQTAVEETLVAAKSVKFIRNGQIVILRDGVEYTILGTQF